MRIKAIAALVTALVWFGITRNVEASTVLGLPDISFDSAQGPGTGLFTPTQGVSYTASNGYLAVSAKALDITYDGITSTPFANGTLDYRAALTSSSSGPGTVTGNFGPSLGSPADLVLMDGSTTLLTGNFQSFTLSGFTTPPLNNLGAGTALFTVTGGTLAPFFTSATGGLVDLTFNVSPGFSSTSFTSDFSGSVKGDVAPPVPIPSGALLMGTGVLLIGILTMKRFETA